MIYESTFTNEEFAPYPHVSMKEIIQGKFLDEHGVVVDETMLALDEDGNVLNRFGPDFVTIVVDVP